MRAFFEYFFGQGDQEEFAIFTITHFAPILVAIALILLIYRFRTNLREMKHEKVFRYIIAFVAIISEMSYYWRLVAIPSLGPNVAENLPISVCGWVAIFASYMVIGKSQTLFDFCYFWALTGSVFALATPTVLSFTGPTRFRFYQFWTEHLIIYIAIFYIIFVHQMRPNKKSFLKAYIGLIVLAGIAYFANQMIGPGANYLYMARPESAPSVLDILPPNFALRLLVMASVITLLFVLVYLPWYIKDKKAEKSEAGTKQDVCTEKV